jgi:Zn-dependent alcohol dehydrogenase
MSEMQGKEEIIKTKAAVLYEYGQPLVIDYLDVKPCLEGEVLVRFKAAGLCRTDLSVIKGNLPLPIPCVPGHEGAGVVEEAGPCLMALIGFRKPVEISTSYWA